MPICTFDVDGEQVEMNLDRIPKLTEYHGIFPAAKVVFLLNWRYCEEKPIPVGVAKWPILSDAAGCAPNQISSMKKRIPELDYTRDGRAIFNSAAHRRRCLKKLRMVDRNSFI